MEALNNCESPMEATKKQIFKKNPSSPTYIIMSHLIKIYAVCKFSYFRLW